jgi:hypothetical protein
MRYALIVCSTLIGSSAAAESLPRASTCTITIHTVKNNGQKDKIVFHTALHSPQECAELARLHRSNFDRDTLRKKTVTFQWDR